MSKIAALSAHVPVRPTPAPVRAPVAPEVEAREVEAPKGGAPRAETDKSIAPTPQAPAFAAEALSMLIELQAKAADPQPGHGADDQHGHHGAPPPVVQPPVSADPQPTHGQDDQHGHKPPVQDPPPVVQPPVAAPAAYDPAAPQRTLAMISARLADERLQDQARAVFAARRAAEAAAVTVAQGQAALAIFQAMQQSYDAWRAGGSQGSGRHA